MVNYQKMYTKLFNAITDAIESIQHGNSDTAKEILIKAQIETEDIYISEDS